MPLRNLWGRLVTSTKARWRWRVAWLVILIVVGSGANLLWTSYAIHKNNLQWCDTLDLVTSRPVTRPADPKKEPAKELSYEFYQAITALKHRQGCVL